MRIFSKLKALNNWQKVLLAFLTVILLGFLTTPAFWLPRLEKVPDSLEINDKALFRRADYGLRDKKGLKREEIYLGDLTGKVTEVVTKNILPERKDIVFLSYSWSPNGRYIAVISAERLPRAFPEEERYLVRYWITDESGNSPKEIYSKEKDDEGTIIYGYYPNPVWSRDSTSILTVPQHYVGTPMYRVSTANAQVTPLNEAELNEFTYTPMGTVFAPESPYYSPDSRYFLSPQRGGCISIKCWEDELKLGVGRIPWQIKKRIEAPLSGLHWLPDSRHFVSESDKGTIITDIQGESQFLPRIYGLITYKASQLDFAKNLLKDQMRFP